MKDPHDLCNDVSFGNEDVWESEHVLYSTQHMHRILDAKYQKSDLGIIMSDSKHLNDNKQSMLRDVLNQYEFLFNGTLGT